MKKEDNKFKSKGKIFFGCIAILYRVVEGCFEFLVVKNAKTGNVTFISGTREDADSSETDTINREIQEELGLQVKEVKLQPTEIRHEFIFGPKKEDRTGQRGSYRVFLADVTDISNSITHTEELRNIKWLSKDEVINSLSFPDLKKVFIKAIKNLL